MTRGCPFCGSENYTSGYGLAAGPMGSYTYCNGCDELIGFSPDLDGAHPDYARQILEWTKGLDARLEEARAKRDGVQPLR